MSEIYNKDIDSLQPSASIALTIKAKQLKESGRDILSLTIGEPNFDTPKPVVDCAIRELLAGNTHYAVGKGIPELRARIAKKYNEENGVKCTAEQVIVTPGAKYAIYLAVRTLMNEGDEAIIPCPCWVSYSSIVTASGGKPVELGLDFENNYAITKEKLESVCTDKTKLLIINSPNNPTGHVMDEKEIAVIRDFVLEHNVFVISDEIYEKIIYDGRKNLSVGAIPEIADKVVTVNGLSKCTAMTGWRVGYLIAEQNLTNKINMLFQHTITCIPGFIQKASCVAFDCFDEVENQRAIFEKRRDMFVKLLSACPAISLNVPEGAFYVWAKINYKGMNCFELSDYLLNTVGVMGIPGDAYGLSGRDCIRFSYATDEATLTEAAARIVRAFSE